MSAPRQQQIHDAITRVHTVLREAWPSSYDEFAEADAVPPMVLVAWAGQWSKARELWIKNVQDFVEMMALAATAADLEAGANYMIETFEKSAQEFRVSMMELLDRK